MLTGSDSDVDLNSRGIPKSYTIELKSLLGVVRFEKNCLMLLVFGLPTIACRLLALVAELLPVLLLLLATLATLVLPTAAAGRVVTCVYLVVTRNSCRSLSA